MARATNGVGILLLGHIRLTGTFIAPSLDPGCTYVPCRVVPLVTATEDVKVRRMQGSWEGARSGSGRIAHARGRACALGDGHDNGDRERTVGSALQPLLPTRGFCSDQQSRRDAAMARPSPLRIWPASLKKWEKAFAASRMVASRLTFTAANVFAVAVTPLVSTNRSSSRLRCSAAHLWIRRSSLYRRARLEVSTAVHD